MLVKFGYIMIKITTKTIPAKFCELKEIRVLRLSGDAFNPRLFLECLYYFFAIVLTCSPAFTVEPYAIYTIIVIEFF